MKHQQQQFRTARSCQSGAGPHAIRECLASLTLAEPRSFRSSDSEHKFDLIGRLSDFEVDLLEDRLGDTMFRVHLGAGTVQRRLSSKIVSRVSRIRSTGPVGVCHHRTAFVVLVVRLFRSNAFPRERSEPVTSVGLGE